MQSTTWISGSAIARTAKKSAMEWSNTARLARRYTAPTAVMEKISICVTSATCAISSLAVARKGMITSRATRWNATAATSRYAPIVSQIPVNVTFAARRCAGLQSILACDACKRPHRFMNGRFMSVCRIGQRRMLRSLIPASKFEKGMDLLRRMPAAGVLRAFDRAFVVEVRRRGWRACARPAVTTKGPWVRRVLGFWCHACRESLLLRGSEEKLL